MTRLVSTPVLLWSRPHPSRDPPPPRHPRLGRWVLAALKLGPDPRSPGWLGFPWVTSPAPLPTSPVLTRPLSPVQAWWRCSTTTGRRATLTCTACTAGVASSRLFSTSCRWAVPRLGGGVGVGGAANAYGKGPGPGTRGRSRFIALERLEARARGQTHVPRQLEGGLGLRHPRLGDPGFRTHLGI